MSTTYEPAPSEVAGEHDPTVDALIADLESRGLGWSLDNTGRLIEARVWDWPHVIGRYRPNATESLAKMLCEAMFHGGLDWTKYPVKSPNDSAMFTNFQNQDEARLAEEWAGADCAGVPGSPRARFEAWITAPPYEREALRYPMDETKTSWPGQYRCIAVQLAWEAWMEGHRTATDEL